MELDLSYAHRRFLGLTGQWTNREETELPLSIRITPGASSFLRSQLEAPGTFRSGPLFGRIRDGFLWIEFAAPRGYGVVSDDDLLKFNPDYVLGWIDALRAAQSQRPLIDWVGCWMSFPDTEMRETETETYWVKQARQSRLVDDFRCLTFIGWRDGEFCAHAYGYDVNFGPRTLAYGSCTDEALRIHGPYPEISEEQE